MGSKVRNTAVSIGFSKWDHRNIGVQGQEVGGNPCGPVSRARTGGAREASLRGQLQVHM